MIPLLMHDGRVEDIDPDDALELGFDGKPFHTGYSRISKYMACPRQYYYVYVAGRRHEIASTPMKRGNAYHGALEAALLRKLDHGKAMGIPKLMEWATYHGEQQGLPDKVIEEVRGACRLWHNVLYGDMEPLFVEGSFTIVRAGVKMTGRVDAGLRKVRTKGGRIVQCDKYGYLADHKFSFDLWTNARAKESVQPMIYQWAWEDVFSKETGLQYSHFAYDVLKTFPYFAAERLEIGRVAVEGSMWYERNIREIAEGMCKGVYFARPSESECGRCSFKSTECQPVLYRVTRRMLTGGE